MGVGDGACHRKPIPVRGYISVARGVPAKGTNPREGIHLTVCTAAVHRRWFWRWRKYEKSEYDGGLHLLAVDVDVYPAGAALCHKPVVCDNRWPNRPSRIGTVA